MYKTLAAPLSVHLEMNTQCNHVCIHCYNFWRKDKVPMSINLTPELAERIILQLKDSNVFHVIINGGEPLMNLSVLLFTIRKLRENNISCSLNTNLTLLSDKSAKMLKDAGLQSILTSLLSCDPKTHDYLTQKKNSFERFLKGMIVAQKIGFRVSVNMVVSKVNVGHVVSTGLFAHKLSAFSFSATRAISPHPFEDEFHNNFELNKEDVCDVIKSLIFLSRSGIFVESLVPYPSCLFETNEEFLLLGNRSCSAGKTSLAIGANAMVRACPHDERVYGDASREKLTEIWQRMSEWRSGKNIPTECRDCKVFPQCGGGCRMAPKCPNDIDPMMTKNSLHVEAIKRKPVTLVVFQDTKMRIRPSCRFRRDQTIGIINTGGIKNTFFSIETFNLLEKLYYEKRVFTPQILVDEYGIEMEKSTRNLFLSEIINRNVAEVLP